MADVIFPGEVPTGNFGMQKLPSNYNMTIWKGDSQKFTIVMEAKDASGVLQPINLNGLTAEAMISASLSGPIQYNYTCTIRDTNKVDLYMPTSITKTIPPGDYIWNFQIVEPNGDARTYLAGDVVVHGEVDD